MKKRKRLWMKAVALFLISVLLLSDGTVVSALGKGARVNALSQAETDISLEESRTPESPPAGTEKDELSEHSEIETPAQAEEEKSEEPEVSVNKEGEIITSLDYFGGNDGPVISREGVENASFGFVMPKFNNRPSSELPLTDVLDDLELQVKVDGEWKNIDNVPYFVFNSTWGWEYQSDWGGWVCWFIVGETTYLRFHGITNDVNLPYTLNFTKLDTVTVTSLANRDPNKTLSPVGGGGVGKELLIINGDNSITYDQAADDIDILVKRESEDEFVPLFDNPESKWIYDQNFGVYTDGPGGWWFNNVEESFIVRFQGKSDTSIYTEFHMTYIKPDRNNTKITPYTTTRFDANKPNHEASIGIELPKIDGTAPVKSELDGFVYQVCVGATYDRGADRWSGGEWKDLSDTSATGWVYQANGYSKYSTSSQWGYWVDYIYGLWFQPVKEDTYLRIGYPLDGTVGGDCGDNFVYYTLIGDPDAVIPDVSDMVDIDVDTGTSTNGDVEDSEITVPEGWEMIWHDEFNGDSVDQSKWTNQTGFLLEEDDITTAGWGNNELEHYTDSKENTSIDNGKLNLTMLDDPKEFSDTNGNTATALYSSGKLISQNKFSVKYGRVDFRAKVPAGKGIWPALWMMPNDSIYGVWASSGEIDVFEGRGRTPEFTFGTLHYGGTWPGNTSTGDTLNMVEDGNVKSDMTEWHVYSLVWEEGNIKIYCDGKGYFKCTSETWYSGAARDNKNAPFDQRFYLIMNLAAGGAFDGNIKPDDDFTQADMYVDYVRVYQRPVEEGEDEKPDTLEGIVTNGAADGLYGDYKLDKVVDVEDITLNKSETSIEAGASEKLTATITPEDATNKMVEWSSSDTTVAKVSGGMIQALKPGKTTITATTKDGGKTATCEVSVTGTPVTGVTLNKETLELNKGESETLTATVLPSDATNKKVNWESSDTAVAKVDSEGKVTAVAAGTATIIVTTEDGAKTASCIVSVTEKDINTGRGVYLENGKLVLYVADKPEAENLLTYFGFYNTKAEAEAATLNNLGGYAMAKSGEKLTYTISGADMSKYLVYAFQDEPQMLKVVELSSLIDGGGGNEDPDPGENLTGKGCIIRDGRVILYVADSPESAGVVAYCRYYDTLEEANKAVLGDLPGYGMTRNGDVFEYDSGVADHGKYLVYGFNQAGADVPKVIAVKDIPVEDDTIEVTGITVNPTKLELEIGESKNLDVTVEPEDATNKEVTFTSTDTSVAAVDGNGTVTAVKAGTATITVTTVEGDKTASCQVTVTKKDTPNPPNPGTSPGGSGNEDSVNTISDPKVDFVIDKITANVQAGLQTRVMNHFLEITASIPMSELRKGLISETPINLNITMDTNSLLKEIKQTDEKKIQLSIVIPKEIGDNKKFTLSSITLDKKVLTQAAALEKEINVLVKNEKGETEYHWDFDSKVIHEDKNPTVNLLIEKILLKDDKTIAKLLNLPKEEKTLRGIIINIKNENTFPWVSTITLSVDKKWGLEQGKKVYVYRYNETTKKLEELPNSVLELTKDGTLELPVIQGGKYIILSKRLDTKIVTPLMGQIKVSPSKKTLSVKSAGNMKVTLPVTIITVKKFTKDPTAVIEGKITYKSGNPSIAAVNSSGKITGKKPGKTTIYTTVQLRNGTKRTYKSGITVR